MSLLDFSTAYKPFQYPWADVQVGGYEQLMAFLDKEPVEESDDECTVCHG